MNLKAKIAMGLVVLMVASAAVTGVAFLSTQQQNAAEEPGLFVGGKKVEDPGVMMTVGENEIGFNEYRYYYLMNKYYAEMTYGAEYWSDDYDGAKAIQLRKAVEETLVQMYTWLQIAEDKGVALTEEEKQGIVDTMNEQKATLGAAAFEKNLQDMFFVSEEQYLAVTEMQTLTKKVQDQMNAEYTEKINAKMDDYFVTAKHILISPDNFTNEAPTPEEELLEAVGSQLPAGSSEAASAPASSEAASAPASSEATSAPAASTVDENAKPEMTDEEKKAAAEELAGGVLAELRMAEAAGMDMDTLFDQMVQQYGTDPGMVESPAGYTFGEGAMVQEFYEGTLALKPGQISELIPTDYGYHIIMRLPLNTEELGEGDPEAAVQQLVGTLMSKEANAVKETLPVGYGAYYNEVNPQSIH